jgi:ankyrin repeat protein
MQALIDTFVESAINGQDKQVDIFLRHGIPIDAKHSVLGYNALYASTALKDPKIMQCLIQGGANVQQVAEVC